MPAQSPTAVLLLLLHSSAPALSQPATTPWGMTGAPLFTVTADTAGESREVPISSNRVLTFIFNTPVQSESDVVVEEREHFRQISLSKDGLMLTLLLSDELPLGKGLRLTVRFADGGPPTSLDFTLVVSPRAEPQVEVYRSLRPCDSYRQQAEEAEERVQQCQTQLARERAEHGVPRGLTGLLASKQMNDKGIRAKRITKDVTLRPGEAFTVYEVVSYRATGGEKETPVTRLAVELRLWNRGTRPWSPTSAQLVGQGGQWDLQVWPPEPIAPNDSLNVLVEVERPGLAHPGPYILKLWDKSGTRTATLSGVTFAE
ncbi:DUF2381 family protein [Vitiosangium sp. GDMCC 1.1324]|uniref:DUF2381 family protein n=1 Tax=Vitiosangium sp. (strain GDMCC 1.1324) TaxID=2138576 RepID=UPI000D39104D|nr:DUF2381 family protein [Vitiosangium sp. GDMCC 1.1324]PTL83768.1 hypothetical protein DAT35_09845 [Vitiosangium sp. GDMCC 1.1324]